ncbi:Cyclin-like protein [Glarea lozoyensis ATCC 20868]|uniref:Cyclin-like protein n=1 Tax=Glarea lozoyensis (strain ATCC 20868 / MF5171) TaxID=1116229 RepID=S3D9V9_GLAL2|nr:Cyclin-like protein [Glarea lozoyensis ATCC 20868]EPE33909.1 Cyclin-like protein [Glarea lozoyensis ATCC 20868]
MSCSIPRELNEAALEHFIYMPVSSQMVNYLARKAQEVISCEPSSARDLPPSPPQTPPQDSSASHLPTIEKFISSIVRKSNVQVPTLMTTLVYLERLKKRLPPMAKGLKCTVHRIFLAALILSAKFLNDSSPKNKHWAEYSRVRGFEPFGFSKTEVNLMEKQLLGLLEWDLNVTNDDLYRHFDPFLAPIRSEILKEEERVRAKESRKRAIKEQQQQEEAARRQYEATQYWMQDCEEKHSVVYQDPYADRAGSTRSRYDSPPSASDIPDLSRSATYDDYCTSSSASSYVEDVSREGTPLSSIGSYMEEEQASYDGPRAYSASPRHHRDVVHIASQHSTGKHSMLPYEIERPYDQAKPSKKPRRAANLFSRFLGQKEVQYTS